MDYKFKVLSSHKEVDLIPYINDFMAKHPESKIYIGCDSQNSPYKTSYGIVVVFHENNKGGHVLYSKSTIAKIRDKFERLWNEILYSVELAEHISNNSNYRPDYIDIDLNPDPRYQSNNILRAALGYVEGMGYVPRCKPNAITASCVADLICK